MYSVFDNWGQFPSLHATKDSLNIYSFVYIHIYVYKALNDIAPQISSKVLPFSIVILPSVYRIISSTSSQADLTACDLLKAPKSSTFL